jgi:elongation factor 3
LFSGVKSLTKAVLKTKNVFFQYPTAPLPQLIDVIIQCSLASRVAVVGVNGAGECCSHCGVVNMIKYVIIARHVL